MASGRWRIWSWEWRGWRNNVRSWVVESPEGRIRYFQSFLGAKLFVMVGIKLRRLRGEEEGQWQAEARRVGEVREAK